MTFKEGLPNLDLCNEAVANIGEGIDKYMQYSSSSKSLAEILPRVDQCNVYDVCVCVCQDGCGRK